AAIGLANGLIVVRTTVPSFLVTLGTLFVLRGLTIALSRLITGRTQIGGLGAAVDYDFWRTILAGDVGPFRVMVMWWIAITLCAMWLLRRTRAGNWIYATGGNADAARNAGVPVRRVKVA